MSAPEPKYKPNVILLDVYETILDMSEIERQVNHMLDSRRGYRFWLALLMQYSFMDNCIGDFHDFPSIAKATLQMAGKYLHVPVAEDEVDDVLHLMKQLPLHDGVPEGLSRLNEQGFRVVALTNTPKEIVRERMQRTGLISYFEAVLSGEEIKKNKPACEVYQWAARKLEVAPTDCLMVTAHDWDVAGAHKAGMETVYIQRPGQMMYPLGPSPTFSAHNLMQVAQAMEGQDLLQ
jgi:2-haloacid dehalogenase